MKNKTKHIVRIITVVLLVLVVLLAFAYIWDLGILSKDDLMNLIVSLVVLVIAIPVFDMLLNKK